MPQSRALSDLFSLDFAKSMTSRTRSYMFIAGDPSGDIHAAPVIGNLLKHDPTSRCFGIGGPCMQAVGFSPLFPFEPFNKMGFVEVAKHIDFFLKAKKQVIDILREKRPSCLICVDYSGFNIPVMKAAHRLGIPVIWYIAPMVWAWKKKRAAVLAKYARHICCIFPFEPEFFKPHTPNVSFVGNPLIEHRSASGPCAPAKKILPENPVLAIVPGSRIQEVSRLLMPMVGAYLLLKEKYPRLRAVVSRYHILPETLFSALSSQSDIEISDSPLIEIVGLSDLAFVTSGTATLETALAGVPHIIAYKTSPITYSIFKLFVTIKYIGLPNIIAGEQVAPECIQQYVTSKVLATEADRFLSDAVLYRSTVEKLIRIRDVLGSKKPSENVADIVRHAV